MTTPPEHWPDELGSDHLQDPIFGEQFSEASARPVVEVAHGALDQFVDLDVDGDTSTAETDMLVVRRDEAGRTGITLVARYRDWLRRNETGWLIVNRRSTFPSPITEASG